MKAKFFLIFIIFLFSSCSPQENRVKKLIRDEFKATMNDYKSYKPISFSKPDTLFTSYEDDPKYDSLITVAIKLKEKLEKEIEDESWNMLNSFMFGLEGIGSKQSDKTVKKLENVVKEMDDFENTYIPKPEGMQIVHSFRENNLTGGVELKKYMFVFDMDYTTILYYYDLDE